MARDGRPELLAPAGDWECARAAVANGADAVYFGTDHLNARMRAHNFTCEDVYGLMEFLHSRGVRGYVTMNVLIFPREMPKAVEYLHLLDDAGVDGVIVQDMGLAGIIAQQRRAGSLRMELHISTQMSVCCPEAVQLVDHLYFPEQIVLARELSLQEIAACAEVTSARIEVFCHGALCVSYSGQCLTSETLGCRSANRGECAQACRLPYRLRVDGKLLDLGPRRFLFSPQDLCTPELVASMLRAGVRSFKIEGRLKSWEYVAAVTRTYRRALDAAMAGEEYTLRNEDLYALRMTFSRGFSAGWLQGTDHPRLTHGTFSKKRGVAVGRVACLTGGCLTLAEEPKVPLVPGDGFVVVSPEFEPEGEMEFGGRIYRIDGKRTLYFRSNSGMDGNGSFLGGMLYKSSDPSLSRYLRSTCKLRELRPKEGKETLDMRFTVQMGKPAQLEARGVCVLSEVLPQPALRHELDEENLRVRLFRLGGTPFVPGKLECRVEPGLMLPIAELNRMRRDLVKKLTEFVSDSRRVHFLPTLAQFDPPKQTAAVELSALCRTLEQAHAALQCGVRRIYLDPVDLRKLSPWTSELRALFPSAQFWGVTLRVMKPRESGYFRFLREMRPDGILIRNLGAARYWLGKSVPLVGDFSLNIANAESVMLWRELGMLACTVSYDLNMHQIRDLLKSGCGPHLELVLHQHIPMFHCEHCVFCTFLSHGHNFKDCGQPCRHHSVRVRDRKGAEHYLVSDEGCRNTLFNARAQSAARCVPDALRCGLSRLRVEFLLEDAIQVRRIMESYNSFLEKKIGVDLLLRKLGVIDRPGVTEPER